MVRTRRSRIRETPKADEEEEDRLSSLQDDLLCRILTLLPTKDAVTTSTRWKNLYASVTHLRFSDYKPGTISSANNKSFIAFVNNVISAVLSKSKYVRKLDLSCCGGRLGSNFESSIVSLIAAVSGPNLQDLFICTYTMRIDSLPLPPQLFHCNALTSMDIRAPFSLCVPEHVLFPSLKSLTFLLVELPDDVSLKRFFSGCVVLEKLSLLSCAIDSIGVFDISIASLKFLSLKRISGDYELFLNTPNLESFDFDGYAARGYSGDILKSLVEAKVIIDVYAKKDVYAKNSYEKVSQLMNMVSNARSLWLVKHSMKSSYYQTTKFHKLTKLNLYARAGGWFSLPKLLANAPCLKVLDFIYGFGGYSNEDLADVESYLQEQVPICVSAHLKEVILGEFYGNEVEFKVVEYFLNNAEVLEKMTISPNLSWDPELKDRVCPSSDKLFPIAKRLLGLPRCSRACQIEFA